MKERKVRDEIILATKFTTCFPDPNNAPRQKINYGGNRYVLVEGVIPKYMLI